MTTDPNHEISSDEVRRQLREASAGHERAMPRWRRSLQQVMDPDTGADAADKAAFLGVPNRRTFVFGGAVLAGGALLAACGKSDDPVPQSGQLPVKPSTTTTTAPGSAATDEVLLQTARSIELLAIEVYGTALDSGLITDQTVTDVAQLFRSQHQEHADALGEAIRAAGGSPTNEANAYLIKNVTEEEVAGLTDQESVLVLARDLENIAAQTYTEAAGVFSTGELRRTGMSIGEVEAKHITVLNIALGYTPVPLSFMPTGRAIDPKGYVEV